MTTFSFAGGTPGATYTIPAGLTGYGSGWRYPGAFDDRIRAYDFSQLVDNTVITSPSTVSAVLAYDSGGPTSEMGLALINSSQTGFSVLFSGTTGIIRKEVAGSGGAIITSSFTSGITTTGDYVIEATWSPLTGDIVVSVDGVQKATGNYVDTVTGMRAGIQNYVDGITSAFKSFTTTFTASATIDSITTDGSPGLVVGQPFAIATTGLSDLAEVVARTTGGLNAITTAINLSAPDGDGTAELKFWIDGEYYPYIGTVSVEATDLTNNPTLNTTLSLPANHVDVVFEDPEATDNTYIGTKLAQAGHPLATGDRGYYINSNSLSISENGHVSCLSAMVFTLWIHKTNYIIEQYSVTVNDAGEVTDAKRVTNRKITTRAITTRLITERL